MNPFITSKEQVGQRALGSENLSTLDGNITPLIVFRKAGAPTDANFLSPVDGLIVIDTTNSKLYVRTGGSWKGVVIS